ncbi:LPS-assembly lipoprotein LptE [Aquabacterium sp. OR-4]|uniref:LPS-assembly lipoprotein LptE n=1 Tax=Aquabacterium sp. OR-4 TaxID=2978127 RepID=UPI0028C59659|nr:LPS assembly lipoprotein LptE [Aquabacterium sp. OR-4]MDT7834026.1 LPS assembly lipoprotein LptE [Aquabacterium sp. OR-4]
MLRRRQLGAVALAAAAAGALGGCGFALRSEPPLPFARIALLGLAADSPLGEELQRRLSGQVQVLPAPAQAEVVLRVLEDRRQKVVAASTAAGQVRELTLRVRLVFRAETPGGRELIPDTELMLSRDMSYSETSALAKEQEEGELYAAMQTDIVLQVLRRLARVSPAR